MLITTYPITSGTNDSRKKFDCFNVNIVLSPANHDTGAPIYNGKYYDGNNSSSHRFFCNYFSFYKYKSYINQYKQNCCKNYDRKDKVIQHAAHKMHLAI